MSHKTLTVDEVVRRVRWVMGGFQEADINKVTMRPNQEFVPLVSIVYKF